METEKINDLKLNTVITNYGYVVALMTSLYSLSLIRISNTFEGFLSIATVVTLADIPWILYFPIKSNVDNEKNIKWFTVYLIINQVINVFVLYKFGFNATVIFISLVYLVGINILIKKYLKKLELIEYKKNSVLASFVMLCGLLLGVYTKLAGMYIFFLCCGIVNSYAYFKVQSVLIKGENI